MVHIFPSCDFANENLARIAPDLLHRVADIAHLLIIIATVWRTPNTKGISIHMWRECLFYAQLRYHYLPSYLTGEETSIFMKITVPCSVIPCNLVDGNWCFRGTCCPHLRGRNSVLASQVTWHPIPQDSNSVVKIPKTDKYHYHNCHPNHHCHHHYYHSHTLYALQM